MSSEELALEQINRKREEKEKLKLKAKKFYNKLLDSVSTDKWKQPAIKKQSTQVKDFNLETAKT